MVQANSLLYAVYICLIVSILCGALLYFSTLYNQLNLFYNSRENLYIQNQSAVNYALGTNFQEAFTSEEITSEIQSTSETKPYGLMQLLLTKSFANTDTITSTHFIGQYASDKTSIYLTDFSQPLTYAGDVKLIGDKKLPSTSISQKYLFNTIGKLKSEGKIEISEKNLPEINPVFKQVFEQKPTRKWQLKDVERKNDSIYFNSFQNETIEIQLAGALLDNVIIKGNFILYARDSILVRKGAILQDVILKSPKIIIADDFKGSIQAFATEEIQVGKQVELQYPSVLCLYNTTSEKSNITVDEKSSIYGAVVLFGNSARKMQENTIELKKSSFLMGDIYCSGMLMVEGTIHGSVYTNKFFHKSGSANHENCIINAEIDSSKKPDYFVSLPLFKSNNSYGIFKKVL